MVLLMSNNTNTQIILGKVFDEYEFERCFRPMNRRLQINYAIFI